MENQDLAVILDKEQLLEKHRKERKDLQPKIQALKKTATKGDKKKKKEVSEAIAQLEKELSDKHAEELKNVIGSENSVENELTGEIQNEVTSMVEMEEESVASEIEKEETGDGEKAELDDSEEFSPRGVENMTRVSRAQKRRIKKQAAEKEREKRVAEEEVTNRMAPRAVELNTIREILVKQGLQIFQIPADGNCLYCAVNHQLEVTGRSCFSVSKLRKMTASFIRGNKDDFLPFMHNEDDIDGEIIDDEQFEKYCKDVEKTKLWGGQLELTALSKILECPIKVIQSTGPYLQGETFEGPPLIVTYHKHMYKLGEHYNSTIELRSGDTDGIEDKEM